MIKDYYTKHYERLRGTEEGKQIELKIKRCEGYSKKYIGKYMEFWEMMQKFPYVVVYVTDFRKGGDCDMVVGGTIVGFSAFYPDEELDVELEKKYGDVLKLPVF